MLFVRMFLMDYEGQDVFFVLSVFLVVYLTGFVAVAILIVSMSNQVLQDDHLQVLLELQKVLNREEAAEIAKQKSKYRLALRHQQRIGVEKIKRNLKAREEAHLENERDKRLAKVKAAAGMFDKNLVFFFFANCFRFFSCVLCVLPIGAVPFFFFLLFRKM